MSKKLVIKNQQSDIVYCVLDETIDFEKQLEEAFSIKPGFGFSVELWKDAVVIKDYFHGEERARLEIISFKSCKDNVNLNWVKQ